MHISIYMCERVVWLYAKNYSFILSLEQPRNNIIDQLLPNLFLNTQHKNAAKHVTYNVRGKGDNK